MRSEDAARSLQDPARREGGLSAGRGVRLGLATLNHSSLHGLPTQWRAHLDAAAEAGFDSIAPDVFWLRALEAEGVSVEMLRRELDARGLGCLEIAGVALGDEATTRAEVEEQLPWAEALGAAFLNTRVVAPVEDALVARSRHAAERFAAVGTRMALEFSRGTELRSVGAARSFSEAIDLPGVGVTLDTWHFFLHPDGPDWAALDALPAERFANVQLSDGVPYEEGAFGEATMNRRRLPGEGDFDLARFAERVRARFGGVEVPVVAEVLSAEEREQDVGDFARRTLEATRNVWG